MRKYSIILIVLLFACNKLTNNKTVSGDENLFSKEIINTNPIEGYAYPFSYETKDTINFKIHSLDSFFDISIELFTQQKSLYKKTGILAEQQNYLESSFKEGCNWNTSFSFTIPKEWKSGYYKAIIKDRKDTSQIIFMLKPKKTFEDILVISSTNTWQAYNTWGGGSFYEPSVFDYGRNYSYQVSFNRPIKKGYYDSPHLLGGETYLLKWLENNKYKFDVICDEDIHDNFDLEPYKVVVLHVHPEYWSSKMRSNLVNYMNKGGDLMYLGGNGIYWKVQLKEGVMECRKDSSMHTLANNSKGGMWRNLNLDESKILGIRYDVVGYNTYAPYMTYLEDSSWILNGTGLKKGSVFGKSEIQGYASGRETDKMTNYTPKNAIIIAKGLNREAIHLLGKKEAETNGGADMIYFETEHGGAVFSVVSLTYTGGLMADSNLSILTKNILDSMLIK